MRKVVTQRASREPADEEGFDRLLAVLATGLERLLSQAQAGKSEPVPVDYPPDLAPTSDECNPSVQSEPLAYQPWVDRFAVTSC